MSNTPYSPEFIEFTPENVSRGHASTSAAPTGVIESHKYTRTQARDDKDYDANYEGPDADTLEDTLDVDFADNYYPDDMTNADVRDTYTLRSHEIDVDDATSLEYDIQELMALEQVESALNALYTEAEKETFTRAYTNLTEGFEVSDADIAVLNDAFPAIYAEAMAQQMETPEKDTEVEPTFTPAHEPTGISADPSSLESSLRERATTQALSEGERVLYDIYTERDTYEPMSDLDDTNTPLCEVEREELAEMNARIRLAAAEICEEDISHGLVDEDFLEPRPDVPALSDEAFTMAANSAERDIMASVLSPDEIYDYNFTMRMANSYGINEEARDKLRDYESRIRAARNADEDTPVMDHAFTR